MFSVLPIVSTTPDHECVLIQGEFNVLGQKVSDNIIEEAKSDLKSLGYTDLVIFREYCQKDQILKALNDTHLKVVVANAHGDADGFAVRGHFIDYREIHIPVWLDHAFLYICKSNSPQASKAFPTSDFKGYGYTNQWACFYWQWLGFPSEGPHTGNYSEIDITFMEGLTAEEAIAIPTTEAFSIPEAAKSVVKEAAIELAKGHNALIQGYENEARNRARNAIDLLNQAYENGWTMAQEIINQLASILSSSSGVGGIVVPVDKFGLLAPYIGLASTITIGAVATAIYVKRVKRRREKP